MPHLLPTVFLIKSKEYSFENGQVLDAVINSAINRAGNGILKSHCIEGKCLGYRRAGLCIEYFVWDTNSIISDRNNKKLLQLKKKCIFQSIF